MSITKTTMVRWSADGVVIERTTGPTHAATGDVYSVEGVEGRNLYEDGLRRIRDLLTRVLEDTAPVVLAPKGDAPQSKVVAQLTGTGLHASGPLTIRSAPPGFGAVSVAGAFAPLRVTGREEGGKAETYTPKVGDVVRVHSEERIIVKISAEGVRNASLAFRNDEWACSDTCCSAQYIRPATPAEREAAGIKEE